MNGLTRYGELPFLVSSLPQSEHGTASSAPDRSPNERVSLRKRSLLIVEDNPSTRTLLSYLLKTKYDIKLAASVDEALALVHQHTFDGLVLDINLREERTGVDLLHAIRLLPAYKKVPAVACTAYTRWGDSERLLSEGFDGYLSKPFTKEQLLGALDQLFVTVTCDAGSSYDA